MKKEGKKRRIEAKNKFDVEISRNLFLIKQEKKQGELKK